MRILIVEDESAIADVERAYLERDGYSVDIAPDGLKALEMFDKEEYDLLLLDIMLPGLSGSDVCTTIRRKSDIPIIMVTAKSGEEDVISGLDAGADDYIIKPFSPRVMMARVRAKYGADYCCRRRTIHRRKIFYGKKIWRHCSHDPQRVSNPI